MSSMHADILVIEDNEADFLLVQRRLRKDDIQGRMQRVDNLDALEQALSDEWQVILYDYRIPGLKFGDALGLIKARRPSLPVILVSGTIDEAMAVRLLETGLTDFILKDNLTRLASAIERAIVEAENQAARRRAEDELRKLARVVEQSPTSILITDTQPRIEYVNDALLETTGYRRDELIGQNPSIFRSGNTPEETYDKLWATLGSGRIWRGELRNRRKNGTEFIENALLAPIRQADGTITHYVAIKQDISAQRESEAMIEQLAYFDRLTDLPNRVLMLQNLGKVVDHSSAVDDYAALLILDIDGFKFINDVQGYEAGDTILKNIADQLVECSPEPGSVARIAGDQFAVIASGLGAEKKLAMVRVRELAESILNRLEQPHQIAPDSPGLRVSGGMGICLFEPGQPSRDVVLNRAEIALQSAKHSGRNEFLFFSPQMQAAAEARSALEAGLRDAIAHQELSLDLQSQYRSDGSLIGAEALLRWQRADGQRVSPGEFIPLAEQTGLIVPIGHWVLERACRLLKHWETSEDTSELILAINISARQFHQPDFVGRIDHHLKESGARPALLKLELTESVVLDDIATTLERMREIRKLGVTLSLDDFGTGYSSLSYLQHLPFDQLKIDQSFVAGMTDKSSNKAIVKAILAMGHALELDIIAEGVETREQFAILQREGCLGFQGYLFARPIALDQWLPADMPSDTPDSR